MKIIILAAGLGKRLGKNLPKSLVKLSNGKSILEHQLDNIGKIMSTGNVLVITGYKNNIIKSSFPHINQVNNTRFDKTNTSKSLLIGLSKLNEDIIFMNGDIVFDPDILKLILENRSNNLICVNRLKVGDEEVKYSLDKDNYINEISKSVTVPSGEAVGINFIKKEYLDNFRQSLVICSDHDYFEKAIENSIKRGVKFAPLDIKNRFCIEIDFKEDLQTADKYLEGKHN